ncbi:hypothetical protein ACWDUB_06420 [Streptomyces fungicidicus]
MTLPIGWPVPPRPEVLQYQCHSTACEHGHPVPGPAVESGSLTIRFGEQRHRSALGCAQHLFGGPCPHPAGLVASCGHQGLRLPLGFLTA